MTRSTLALGLCSLVLVLCACKGIGRELVSAGGTDKSGTYSCEAMLATCEPFEPVKTTSERAPTQQSMPECALSGVGPERSDLNLRDCVLHIDATSPAVRVLVHSVLFRVRIELHGNASLRLHDSDLNAVAISGDASESGPQGNLELSHSELFASDVRVGRLNLVTSSLQSSTLAARELIANDIEAISCELSGSDLLLSSALVLFSAIPRCDALLLTGSDLRNVRIEACSGLARAYEATLTRVQFDGEIESDRSSFAGGVFGLEAETKLLAYRSSVNSVIFCRQFQRLRMSTGSLSCSDCEGPLEEADADVCTEQNFVTGVDEGNLCESLMALPLCETFPRRTRPLNEI